MHHTAFECDHTASTARQIHQNKPTETLHKSHLFSKELKDSTNQHFPGEFPTSASPENMHAQVYHRERLVTSASTPSAKASHSIGTQSHHLNGLTNPQQRARPQTDDQEKPLHDPYLFAHEPKDSNNQIFPRYSKPSHHPRTCTQRSRITNISSPALARHEQKHHAA